MSLRSSTIPLLICLFLSGCRNSSSSSFDEPLDSSLFNMKRIDPVCGEWAHSIFMSGSQLSIKEDSTFRFHFSGCLGQRYTAGRWEKRGHNLLLTSYDIYKTPRRFSDTSYVYFKNARFEIGENLLIDQTEDTKDPRVYKKINYY